MEAMTFAMRNKMMQKDAIWSDSESENTDSSHYANFGETVVVIKTASGATSDD